MSNDKDRSIEAAGKEAERLLAELEERAPAGHTQDANPSLPTPTRPHISSHPTPQAATIRGRPGGLVWLFVIALVSIAGTLGVVGTLSTNRPSSSIQTQQQPSGSEPQNAEEPSAPKVHTEPYTSAIPNESSAQVSSGEALSQEQALSIIKGWLDGKPKVFAPPFISRAVDSYVANGPLWYDITKPGGSIDWLKANDSHYSYAFNTINSTISFSGKTNEPSITVSVTQDMAFHSPKGTKPTNSTDTYQYTFRQEHGSWKIWDYEKR